MHQRLISAIIDIATIINVIVIHEIDARERLKFLKTLLKASLILLLNILKNFILHSLLSQDV